MILDLGGGVSYIAGGYFGSVWGGGVGVAAPPAPPSVEQGGGVYLPVLPATGPRLYTYRGVIFLGRLRVGSRVLFLENRAQAEDEELIALL